MTAREHGTNRGYLQHINRGEETCPECKSAHAEYNRAYRNGNPDAAAYNRANRTAYQRAEGRLRERHRDEFNQLYAEERQLRGLK